MHGRGLLASTALAVLALLWPASGRPDISGRVVDVVDGTPLAGAVVAIRARPELGRAVTGEDGHFHLAMTAAGPLEIGAALPHDPARPRNYLSETQQVFDGMSQVLIELPRLPGLDNPTYLPPSTQQSCRSCHSAYYTQWAGSRHAGAAVNSWVLDLFSGTGTPGGAAGYVFRNLHDPDDTGFCATCHAPMQDVRVPGGMMLDEVDSPAGLEGVNCHACHQLAHVNDDIDALHHRGNGEYRFPLGTSDSSFYVWGSLPDVPTSPMQNSYSPLHADSKLCASCHQYTNPVTGAPGQNTYREWLASPYAQPGPGQRHCQGCHMPTQSGSAVIGSGGPSRPGSQRHAHTMTGATPARLAENILLRVKSRQEGAQLVVEAEVENRCGHNFPTGISLRNALLVVDVRLDGEPLAQSGGGVVPWWADDDVPGEQPGDYAGRPGRGFAKVLAGRINGSGPEVAPVLFIDAETVLEDSGIASGATDRSGYRFQVPVGLPPGVQASVDVRLLYRRAWRALAVTKGWTQTPGGMPVEIQVQRVQLAQPLAPVPDRVFLDGFELPP